MPLSRRRFLVAAAFAALPFRVWAAGDPAVLGPVRALIDALLAIMKQGTGVPFARRAETLAPILERSMDLDAILRASAGSAIAAMPPADRDALRAAFRDYTVASYVHSFDTAGGQRFEVQPDTRAVGNGDQVVQTRIISANGEPHALDYVMHGEAGVWRAVDVLAEGSVSRVAVQRSDFRRLLSEGGSTALIDSLRSKARELAKP
jgi:phospholipid transport system substrate-binding protein